MYSVPLELPDSPVSTTAAARPATRTPAELIERYAARSGRDVSAVSWYTAFAWFKLAVILEGIHYRYTLGPDGRRAASTASASWSPSSSSTACTTLQEG